jgi:hypothetical protein
MLIDFGCIGGSGYEVPYGHKHLLCRDLINGKLSQISRPAKQVEKRVHPRNYAAA